MPARLWEFLIGYAVAAHLTNVGAIIKHRYSWLGGVGLMVMLAIPLMPVEGQGRSLLVGHPALYALGVALATAAVLAYGLPSFLEKTSVFKLFEGIGNYSYSIYLVHFPVIVFYFYEPFRGTLLTSTKPSDTLILAVLIMLISYLMYRFIESPPRKTNRLAFKYISFSLLIPAFVLLGHQYQKLNYSSKEMLIFNAFQDRDSFRCSYSTRLLHPFDISCELTSMTEPAQYRVLLVGNSHADAIKNTFAAVAEEAKIAVRFMVRNDALMRGGVSPETVVQHAAEKDIELIVLHHSDLVIEPELIRKLVLLSKERGIRVSMIMPVPTWSDQSIPEALYAHLLTGHELPALSLARYNASVEGIRVAISQIDSPSFAFYEVGGVFCQPECKHTNEDGVPLYFDHHHLTLTGSGYLKPIFYKLLDDAFILTPRGSTFRPGAS